MILIIMEHGVISKSHTPLAILLNFAISILKLECTKLHIH